jgi:hypothetical protein
VQEHLGDPVGMMSDVVFKTAVEKLMDGEELYKTAKTMQMLNEWLQSTGEQDSEAMTEDIEVTFANE